MKLFHRHDLHRQIWREIEALSAKLRDGGMCEEQAARRATRVVEELRHPKARRAERPAATRKEDAA